MDKWIVVIIGLAFMLLGVGALVWWRFETRRYYEALTNRQDVREFLERSPIRPEPEALQIGGIMLLAVGALMLALGIFWL